MVLEPGCFPLGFDHRAGTRHSPVSLRRHGQEQGPRPIQDIHQPSINRTAVRLPRRGNRTNTNSRRTTTPPPASGLPLRHPTPVHLPNTVPFNSTAESVIAAAVAAVDPVDDPADATSIADSSLVGAKGRSVAPDGARAFAPLENVCGREVSRLEGLATGWAMTVGQASAMLRAREADGLTRAQAEEAGRHGGESGELHRSLRLFREEESRLARRNIRGRDAQGLLISCSRGPLVQGPRPQLPIKIQYQAVSLGVVYFR